MAALGEDGSAIAGMLERCRQGMERVGPASLEAELAAGSLVVDIRCVEHRQRDGELPGAVVIDRNVLEWRLDPTSPYRIPEARSGRKVVVVCSEGYGSVLAAHSLRQLGLHDATDLEGGFQAWAALHGVE